MGQKGITRRRGLVLTLERKEKQKKKGGRVEKRYVCS